MLVTKVIVVGDGIVDAADDLIDQHNIRRVHSCRDAQRLLDHDSSVHLICTDVKLPDGSWCDVLRLVVNSRITAEVRVLSADGRALLRLELKPRHCSVHALDSIVHESLAMAPSFGASGPSSWPPAE